MTSTRHLLGFVLVGATLVSTACTSDSKSSSTSSSDTSASETTAESDASDTTATPDSSNAESADGLVAAGLRQIPAAVRDPGDDSDGTQIAISDLDAATRLAGIDRPTDGTTDVNDISAWLSAISGPGREDKRPIVAALLPDAAHTESFAKVGEFADEVGWSISDVHTFAEYQVPPGVFTAMTGTFSEDALTTALGKPADGVWSVGGEDFSTDLDSVSAARPIGEALRFAVHGDTLAVARSTPSIEAWNALDTSTASTLADDEELGAVAAALDESGVYSALLSQDDFAAPGANVTPQAQAAAEAAALGPFTTLGVGQTVEDGAPLAVFVYYFADEDAAAAAVDPLTTLLDDGVSNRTRTPWNESFAIGDITATGHILKATLRLTDFPPSAVWSIIFTRDNLTTGSE